jgi:hypothetical protein
MKITMTLTHKFVVVLSSAAIALIAQGASHLAVAGQPSRGHVSQGTTTDSDVFDEAPDPSDSRALESRRSKNTRYNTGRLDLTSPNAENDRFFEQVWPRTELIPALQSATVATGTVVKLQPYLSADRSRIYTEISIRLDNTLKPSKTNLSSAVATLLIIDRLGGALRLRSGRIVRDEVQIDGLGGICLGKRYLFFAAAVHNGRDLTLIRSYELTGGEVFTNDSRPRRLISATPSVPKEWALEETFLAAVREVISKRTSRR